MSKHLYQALAETLEVIERLETQDLNPREEILLSVWEDRLKAIMATAPSGSGIDTGTKLREFKSSSQKLVFEFGYHHMNEGGYYDGWTEHSLIVTPTFQGLGMRITGRDRNQIKDYLYDVYHHWLNGTEVPALDLKPVQEHDREAMSDQRYHKVS